ncbi:VHL beta domain-containing protein [Palleronia abyssalis]|uniref:von Hippel-Lindau disease tumour suppressor beta domain-containing protein n=1 Tax=Palleronia abyssalis TaxID=1501240 RepID=A0A2R8BVU8_9RHOB|nr:hypothetical protein [Palleronia abyssalis]SPJ24281.1 hypothetical protein PAA8504_02109 [Palleronia abyssalis]
MDHAGREGGLSARRYTDLGKPLSLENAFGEWRLTIPTRLDGVYVGGIVGVDGRDFDVQYGIEDGFAVRSLSGAELIAIRNGNDLTVFIAGDTPPDFIPLTGSAAALLKVEECNQRLTPPRPTVAARAPLDTCPMPGTHASPGSQAPLTVTFVNQAPEAVDLYWIDFEGNTKPYFHIDTGDVATVKTYLGHNWVAVSDDGASCFDGVRTVRAGDTYIDVGQ